MRTETAPSQKELLLAMLRTKGDEGVTPLEALTQIGSFRLAARIFDLRRDDYDIETVAFRTERGADVARYILHVVPRPKLDQVPGQLTAFDWDTSV